MSLYYSDHVFGQVPSFITTGRKKEVLLLHEKLDLERKFAFKPDHSLKRPFPPSSFAARENALF